MEPTQFSADPHTSTDPHAYPHTTVTRLDDLRWRAVEDDHVVGSGEASRRPDGRTYLSIDTWHGTVFDLLAAAMTADLPGPLHTLVDETDHDLTARWRRAGLTVARREREYLVTTDPRATGLDAVPTPPDVTVVGLGGAHPDTLREGYRAVRAEVDAAVGWDTMPVEVPPGAPLDPARYAVAEAAGRYVGLVRVVSRRRHARIGLVAVREAHRRRGIARALLAEVLDTLHRNGIATATAEVDDRNTAAAALFEGIGARRVGGTVVLGRGA